MRWLGHRNQLLLSTLPIILPLGLSGSLEPLGGCGGNPSPCFLSLALGAALLKQCIVS